VALLWIRSNRSMSGGGRGGVGKNMQQICIEDCLGSTNVKPSTDVNKAWHQQIPDLLLGQHFRL